LCVHTQGAVPLFGSEADQRKKHAEGECTERLHAIPLDKGFDRNFATPKTSGCLSLS
jgi:hypothetical protein